MSSNASSKVPELGKQELPGHQHRMPTETCDTCLPVDPAFSRSVPYCAAGKLQDKVALITGGDSGIGRATALLFALEGAKVVIAYAQEDKDAHDTLSMIRERCGASHPCEAIRCDLSEEGEAKACVASVVKNYGRVDTLVCNHGVQHVVEDILALPASQWRDTFATNVHAFFYLVQAALPHMGPGSTVLFNASVNAYKGHGELVDYTATKGAIVAFARALSNQVVKSRGVRVNVVAPGPIVTPLISATMTDEQKASFGLKTPMGRPGQPSEVAACFVFLASSDSSYISGSTIHPNGGTVTAS